MEPNLGGKQIKKTGPGRHQKVIITRGGFV